MKRNIFDEDHEALREVAREFAQKDVVPHLDAWAKAGLIDKGMFRKAGAQGLLGMTVPTEYGGGGMDDFRFSVVVNEELARYCGNAIAMAITGYNDLCAPYFEEFASPEQHPREAREIRGRRKQTRMSADAVKKRCRFIVHRALHQAFAPHSIALGGRAERAE